MTRQDTETDFFATELMMAGDVPFEERRSHLLDAARKYLDYHRNLCHELHNSGGSGREVVACVTAMADELIRNMYQC